ncbi:helicase-like protein [Tanacetum coccineum]
MSTTTTNTAATNTTTINNNSNPNNNNTGTDNNNNNPRTPYRAILQHRDEIEEYLSCRCNRVCFRDDDDVDDVLERETVRMSKFTPWIKANKIYPHAHTLREIFPYIYEDVARNQRRLLHNEAVVFTDEEILNYTLLELETILNSNNKSLIDFRDLLQIEYTLLNISRNRLIAAERMYNVNEEWTHFTNFYVGLNPQQRDVYDNIIQAVDERRIVLSVASSGIASLVLPGGRTAHSRFRIPIDLDDESRCGIDVISDLASLIRASDLIIWDEAPLQHRHAFEAGDRTFRDMCKLDNPNAENQVFGGKVVVLGGDFRQILQLIPNAPRVVMVASTVNKSSSVWDHCKVFVLSINMRLRDPQLMLHMPMK